MTPNSLATRAGETASSPSASAIPTAASAIRPALSEGFGLRLGGSCSPQSSARLPFAPPGFPAFFAATFVSSAEIDTSKGIDEQGFVRIGGVEQWISVRGDDRSSPVFLALHGGPGASTAIFGPRTRFWARLGADKVVLLGHSYGSAFALRLARAFPERYSAYVGTDQNIHDAGRDDSVHRALLARLRATR